jgi:outer membrane protein
MNPVATLGHPPRYRDVAVAVVAALALAPAWLPAGAALAAARDDAAAATARTGPQAAAPAAAPEATPPAVGYAAAARIPLTLDEAIAMALRKNEDIVVERESLLAAREGVTGAKGAYDPVLELNGDWRRATQPVNSAFSGAPAGKDAPTIETAGMDASLRQLLPTGGSVTLSTAASRATTDGSFTLLSPAYATRAGLEVRQPLLRDRATDPARAAIRVAASDRRRAAASLRREVSDTVAAVEQAYWTLVAAHREIAVREEAVRLASEQLSETGIRVEKGAVPETEIAQPRAELERRRNELFTALQADARADNALKLLIFGDDDGAAWGEHLAPRDDPEAPVVAVDVAQAMQRALRERPELEEAEALRERRRTETALARDAVRPALDAVASYDRFGLAGGANPAGATIPGLTLTIPDGMEGAWGRSYALIGEDRFDDTRVGLQLSIPLGNRQARAGAAIARSAERQADADLVRARKTVRAEILDAAAALETAGQRIEASRSAREAAEVQLSAERDRYEAGLSTNFLVLTRQNDLSRARLDEIAALTDYRRARAEMARASGSLLEERSIEIDDAGNGERPAQ